MNDEVFEGYGDSLEGKEPEGAVYHPLLTHEIASEVETR